MATGSDSSSPEQFQAIQTQWSLIDRAHRGSATSIGQARNALALRYRKAIRSYLGALLKDDSAADELAQDVLVRLLNGEFASAAPDKGRFRNFLKVAVHNMARSYWDKRKRTATVDVDPNTLGACDPSEADSCWMDDWRGTILQSAWDLLKEYEKDHPGNLYYTLFRLRSESPSTRSNDLAVRLAEETGQNVTAAAARQSLRRARFLFAQYVVEEVARSLAEPTAEAVEEELADLGLMKYVRDFMPADWRTNGMLLVDAHK
jgi:DNA-directed RNA polymerase specialized sigma24 family protein